MDVVFRLDSSFQIGTGHLMRCLCLASELTKKGVRSSFICRDLAGNLSSLILDGGFELHRLPASQADWSSDAAETRQVLVGRQIDWLVVDHYGLGKEWEHKLRVSAKKILAIDDLANREHDCDWLLDQNLYAEMDVRYKSLIPSACQSLLGPGYALLRPEFKAARAAAKPRSGPLKRILIFFGGSDPDNETAKALAGVAQFLKVRAEINVDVVVGASNSHRAQIEKICAGLENVSYHCQISNIAELMRRADLAIGAGGSASLERCSVGLPALVTILSEDQRLPSESLGKRGAILILGWHENIEPTDYLEKLMHLDSKQIQSMSEKAWAIVDSDGCSRVVSEVFGL